MRAQGERWSSRMPDLRLVLSRALILPVAITAVTLVPTQVLVHAQSSAEFVPVTDTNSRAYLGGTFLERWDGSRAVSRGGRAGHRIGRA
ncbi:MAG: hypothetical protein MK358_14160, partial [Vicinamibacterales bacterium]|nr:hypothetical protein [Vicinamibacterales bacterium]